jgi:hypothetical protein
VEAIFVENECDTHTIVNSIFAYQSFPLETVHRDSGKLITQVPCRGPVLSIIPSHRAVFRKLSRSGRLSPEELVSDFQADECRSELQLLQCLGIQH